MLLHIVPLSRTAIGVLDVSLDFLDPLGYLTTHSDIVSLAERPGNDSKLELGLNPVDMGMKTSSITFRIAPLKYVLQPLFVSITILKAMS